MIRKRGLKHVQGQVRRAVPEFSVAAEGQTVTRSTLDTGLLALFPLKDITGSLAAQV